MLNILRTFILISLIPFGFLVADPIPDNSRVLILGPAADIHAVALQGLIDGDHSVNTRGIVIDSFQIGDTNQHDTIMYELFGTSAPFQANAMLQKLDEDFDVILVHADRYILQYPESFMESVRLLQRYTRPLGSKLMLVLPPHSSEQIMFAGHSYEDYPADNATMVKEQAYRIGDALDLEVIPVGLTWQLLEQDPVITVPGFSIQPTYGFTNYPEYYVPDHYYPELYQGNVYATTIYSALFEATPAQSTYRHEGIDNGEFLQICTYAYDTWDQARSADQYTGEYMGTFSPVIPTAEHPDLLYDPTKQYTIGGASTEGFTMVEFRKIFEFKGITIAGQSNPIDYSWEDYQFNLNRSSPVIHPNAVGVFQRYKVGGMEKHFTYRRTSGTRRAPYYKDNPNFTAFGRMWTEDPDYNFDNIGDGHLNRNASMTMAASLSTLMTGGEHPFLDGAVDLDLWTGPQRFAAAMGYGVVMGLGKLAKLEHPPVSIGIPRHYVQREVANVITLEGFDFDGVPVAVEILDAPDFGTLTPTSLLENENYSGISGQNYMYTPEAGFDGLDAVTYRVVNANGASQPLTVYLSVGPYEPKPLDGLVIFSDDFDDQDISDWEFSINEWELPGFEFATASSSKSWLGVLMPYDGTASLRLWGNDPAERGIDTTAFNNIELTFRIGVGVADHSFNSFNASQNFTAEVEWYDGTTWHSLMTYDVTEVNMRLLETFQVELPAGASNNEEFRLRLRNGTPDKSGSAAYFDSIVLSGEPILTAPVSSDLAFPVAKNMPVNFALEANDINIFDTLSYSYSQPSHGTVTGSGPGVTYTPDTEYTGPDSFTYTAHDGALGSNVATVTLNVRENTAPIVDLGADQVISMLPIPYWSPSDMVTVGWYDASDSESIFHTEGSVNQWQDKSGNGMHLNNPDLSGPITNSDTIHGLNALRFDASKLETATNPFGAQVNDAFVMMVHRIDAHQDGYLFSLTGESADQVWRASVTNRLGWVQFFTAGGAGANRVTTNTNYGNGSVNLFGFYGSTTDNVQQVFTNGDMSAGDTSGHSADVSGPIVFGKSTAFDTQKSTLGELVIINGTVSTENRQKLEGYMAHKWGLEDKLALDHPYKVYAPGGPYAAFDLVGSVNDAEGDDTQLVWTQRSGPGDATFGDINASTTSVTLLDPGTYVFRLTSHDGLAESFDEVTITITQPAVDEDHDGIADSWETEHFPGQEGTIDGTADSDGDTVLDFFEYLFGSDPNDDQSMGGAFHVLPNSGGAAPLIEWRVAPGMVAGVNYVIRCSTDMVSWDPLPEGQYTLHTVPEAGATRVELLFTPEGVNGHLFVRLQSP